MFTDAELLAHLGLPPDTPVVHLAGEGRQKAAHRCADGWRDVWCGRPVCWSPTGSPPSLSCFVGRCENCGSTLVTSPTES
jgi:hypothetical protein